MKGATVGGGHSVGVNGVQNPNTEFEHSALVKVSPPMAGGSEQGGL